MHAELLAVGSELTSGQTPNTNVTYLARRLQELGIACLRQIALPDASAIIVEELRQALRRSPLVIVTGGLGPTVDDLTLEAIATATNRPLLLHPPVARRIRAFYRAHHRRLAPRALRQASVPSGAAALPNPLGTAPGLWLRLGTTVLVALPGVPREMRAILDGSVLPRLRRLQRTRPTVSRTIRTIGWVELQIQAALKQILIPPSVELGLYPHLLMVDARFTVRGRPRRVAVRLLDRLEGALRRRLGDVVYGIDQQTLEGVIGQLLARRHATLAIAESCTGGLVADLTTNVPGSSRYFLLGVIAYHNRMKEELLGVSQRLVARHGAVSEPVARAMAEGVRRRAKADYGLAITGIAGPTGGTAKKPVGLVDIGLSDGRRTLTRRCHFVGDRSAVKAQAAQTALDWLRRSLLRRRVIR